MLLWKQRCDNKQKIKKSVLFSKTFFICCIAEQAKGKKNRKKMSQRRVWLQGWWWVESGRWACSL